MGLTEPIPYIINVGIAFDKESNHIKFDLICIN